MTNKIETSHSGMFLSTKLKVLLDDLNKNLIDSKLVAKEEVFTLFNKTIKEYQKTLQKSLLNYKSVSPGVDPDVNKFNADNLIIYNDLLILYSSLKNIRNLLSSNFNTLSGMIMKIKADIAEASAGLADYKLQNSNKLNPSFSDSFFNLSKIESEENKYTDQKAFVDTFNNNVVLPLDKEATTGKIKKVNISEDSVGVSGNNQEVGGIARDSLKLAFDNSIDTWFEFEQVGSSEIEVPTILNIKLELEEEIFFNLLDINTVQMPNGSYPAITEIKGSTDGSNFFDLTNLYLGDWDYDSIGTRIIPLGEKPENPNGENLLYFTPRKIKFLTVKLIEDSSYFIRTSSGVKYRRAIGLKEIKAKSQKFKNKGQLITTNFLSNKEISKVAIFTDESFPSGFKSTFNYFISVDNGLNWDEISPSQRLKEKIPEILTYNVDFLSSSKKTNFPVASIKLKCDFKIEEGDESTSITSSFISKKQTEFKTISAGTKSLILEKTPFGSVHLYKTNYGSVGKSSYYKIPNSSLKELDDRYLIQLPLDVYPGESIQINQEELFIDNYSWARVDELLPAHSVSLNQNSFVYEFDYVNNIITFNKLEGLERLGRKPNGDILFKLKRENVSLKTEGSYTEIKTNFPHDGIKENILVYSIEESPSSVAYKLKNRASVHRVMVEEIENISVVSDASNILNEEKDFLNGVAELRNPGDYSIDKKKGIIYTYTALDNVQEVKINVFYKKKNFINFEIVDGQLRTTDLLKKDNKVFKLDIVTQSYAIDLGFRNIEEKSVVFTKFPSSLNTEVPYSNIDVEFNEVATSGKYAIDYKNGILYLQNKTSGEFVGTLVNSNYLAEYDISYKIPETDYTVVTGDSRVDFSDKFVSDYNNASANESFSANLLKVEYLYTEEVKESLTELFPYTTPFIKEYKIVITPKESL